MSKPTKAELAYRSKRSARFDDKGQPLKFPSSGGKYIRKPDGSLEKAKSAAAKKED